MQSGKSYIFKSIFIVLVIAISVTSCSKTGDFGRPRQLKIQGAAIAYTSDIMMGAGLVDITQKPGLHKGDPFGLTKPEILIRDASVHFSQPLTKNIIKFGKRVSPLEYAEYITSSDFTHGDSRVGFVSSQIKSDFIWLKRFAVSARKVKHDDGDRALYLEVSKIGLTDQDRVRTYSRIKENEEIVYDIFMSLDDRIASYSYAIKRIPLEIPGTSVKELQMALKVLRKNAAETRAKYDKLARRLARRRINLARRWQARTKRKKHRNTRDSHGDHERKSSRRGFLGTTLLGDRTEHQEARDRRHSYRNNYSGKENGAIHGQATKTQLKLLPPIVTKLKLPRNTGAVPITKSKRPNIPLPNKNEPIKPVIKIEKPQQEPAKDKWPMVITPTP